MEAARSSETVVSYDTIQCHNPEGLNFIFTAVKTSYPTNKNQLIITVLRQPLKIKTNTARNTQNLAEFLSLCKVTHSKKNVNACGTSK
jgi:hypothetical protein